MAANNYAKGSYKIDDPSNRDLASMGRRTARKLWEEGIEARTLPDPRQSEFAEAALAMLEELQVDTPGIMREVLEGAELSAGQLNLCDFDGFDGLVEILQNADDLGAKKS